ncbi:MAG TPA: hypothetical protein VH643_24675, partial [Gemmataceae bacterium]
MAKRPRLFGKLKRLVFPPFPDARTAPENLHQSSLEQRLRRLAWIVEEIRTVETRLAKVTDKDTTIGWLRSIKGIGPVTA